jgi:fumarate hydratase class I
MLSAFSRFGRAPRTAQYALRLYRSRGAVLPGFASARAFVSDPKSNPGRHDQGAFQFQTLFESNCFKESESLSYKKLDRLSGGVTTVDVEGTEFLKVDPSVLTELTAEALKDVSHLLRRDHLVQLKKILDDPEASSNDRFVALELLKNANIAAGMVLPGCQDTGTGTVIAKKGEQVLTFSNDDIALSKGVFKAYSENNLRFSQVAPTSMFAEKNTGTNLPAQIDVFATPGAEYKFLFMAKGGGSANKTQLYQKTKAVLNDKALAEFLKEEVTKIGTAACPPYHLAIVVRAHTHTHIITRIFNVYAFLLMLSVCVCLCRSGG